MSKGFLPLAVAAIVLAALAFSIVATRPTSNAVAGIENASSPEEQPEEGQPEPSIPITGLASDEPQEADPATYYVLRSLSPVKNYTFASRLYDGYRWGAMPVKYSLSSEGLNVPENFYAAARSALGFWQNLSEGKIAFEEVPAESASLRIIFDTNYAIEHNRLGEAKGTVRYGGFAPYAIRMEVRISSPTNVCKAYWEAAHEVGHALGFGHSNSKDSVMYGYGDSCIGGATPDVEEAVKEMYIDFPQRADLRIANAQALRAGERLSVWYDISNIGVKDSGTFDAAIAGNGGVLGQIKLENIPPGGREQSRADFTIPADAALVTLGFIADGSSTVEEIDESDNAVELFPEV